MNCEPDGLYLEKVSFSLQKIMNSISASSCGKKFCVCLSGGADSTALLIALHLLKEQCGFELCAAHVNHLLRGEEAIRDEDFCVDMCKKIDVVLFHTRIDVNVLAKKNKKSIEETARDVRYAYFKEMKNSNKIDYFLTAHTKNDNAETLYMHLIRGTTTSGLCGIPQINGFILRPLLEVSREENQTFLFKKGYSYVSDSSNNDNAYTRNYIRNVLLPATEKINPKSIEAADLLIRYAKTDELYFDSVLQNIPRNIKDSELHPALLRRKLQREYTSFSSGKSLMTIHLDALLQFVYEHKNKSITMPNDIIAVIKNGSVSFQHKKETVKVIDKGIYELKFGLNSFASGLISIHLLGNNSFNETNIYNNDTHTKLYFGNIVGRVKFRARQPGDKIFCRGVNRSIKKEFIAKGIPVQLREAIPIFFDEQGIIYVPFIGTADRIYAPDSQNEQDLAIITVEIKERQDE